MTLKLLSYLFIAALLIALLTVLVGQLGWLKGEMPLDLGVRNGRLKPPSPTPNSVSSQAKLYLGPGAQYAQIEPFRLQGESAAALTRLGEIILKMPGARIMSSSADYLYVQFQTPVLKFVDDTEFWVDQHHNVIHVRSASRLGRKDFGVNRRRVESIRAAFSSTPLSAPPTPAGSAPAGLAEQSRRSDR